MIYNVSDRTVHASWGGWEIVRYYRQGHWYIEAAGLRTRVTVGEAAARAKELVAQGGTVFFGEYGGGYFDKRVRS